MAISRLAGHQAILVGNPPVFYTELQYLLVELIIDKIQPHQPFTTK